MSGKQIWGTVARLGGALGAIHQCGVFGACVHAGCLAQGRHGSKRCCVLGIPPCTTARAPILKATRWRCAGADEAGAKLLSKVTLHAARSAEGVAVGRNGRLRLLPLPTPRWPDLLVVHSAEDRCSTGFRNAHSLEFPACDRLCQRRLLGVGACCRYIWPC